MFDERRLEAILGDMGRSGKRRRRIAAPDMAADQPVAGAVGMHQRRTLGHCRIGVGEMRQGLPLDREIGEIRCGLGLEGHQRHRLAPKPRTGFREGRLVGKGRDHPEAVASGNIGGGKDRRDPAPRRPGGKIAEPERSMRMRAADRKQSQRAVGPVVGPEPLGAL